MSDPKQSESFAWFRADATYHGLLAPELGEAARDPAHAELLAARALHLRAAKLGGVVPPASEVSLAPLAQLPALRAVALTRIYLRQPDVDTLAGLTALEAITLHAYGDAIQEPLDLTPLCALKGLRQLALVNLRAHSLAPITTLLGLRSLKIRYYAAMGALVAAPERLSLARLRGLKELEITDRLAPAVFDLADLGRCARLRDLRWSDSDDAPLLSAAPLVRLHQLRRVDLADTRLKTLDGLWETPLEVLSVPATVPEAEVNAFRGAQPACEVYRAGVGP